MNQRQHDAIINRIIANLEDRYEEALNKRTEQWNAKALAYRIAKAVVINVNAEGQTK